MHEDGEMNFFNCGIAATQNITFSVGNTRVHDIYPKKDGQSLTKLSADTVSSNLRIIVLGPKLER